MMNIDSDILKLFSKSLSVGRVLLLDNFIEYIGKINIDKELDVALIGGLENEPEVILLQNKGFELNIDYYGISEKDIFLDLNKKNNKSVLNKEYDLVICCQVLEHIWNTSNFFSNIELFKSDKTLIYINFPRSNKFHSNKIENHTDFNSTGYSKYFILNNIEDMELIPIEVEEIGTERLYKSIHVLQTWYNYHEIIKCFRAERKNYLKYFLRPYNLVNFLLLKKASNQRTSNPKFTTETYCFLK